MNTKRSSEKNAVIRRNDEYLRVHSRFGTDWTRHIESAWYTNTDSKLAQRIANSVGGNLEQIAN